MKEITDLLEELDATLSKESDYRHSISNSSCKIVFLKERYENEYVVVVSLPCKSFNLQQLVAQRDESNSVPTELEDLMLYTLNLCKEILKGDYSKIDSLLN
jgi:hypothetical protein